MVRRIEAYPTPQQALLEVAEDRWGPQFDEKHEQQWHTFTEIAGLTTGSYAGVTNGTDYYTVDEETGYFRELLVSPDRQTAIPGGVFSAFKDKQGRFQYSFVLGIE
jgi:hypothetical protein